MTHILLTNKLTVHLSLTILTATVPGEPGLDGFIEAN